MQLEAFKKDRIGDLDLAHISEVQRGLACHCVCPYCKKDLIARKGNKKAHHFAHYEVADCGYGPQTVLHKQAKEILERRKTFQIPIFNVKYKDIIEPVVAKEMVIKFDNIESEKRQEKIIPDIIGVLKGHKIFIEIFVTHKVNDEKKSYIRSENASCIEIDLSKENRNIEQKFLEEKIIYNTKNKKWIHHSKYKKAREMAKSKWNKKQKKQDEKERIIKAKAKEIYHKSQKNYKSANILKTNFHLPDAPYQMEINKITPILNFPSKFDDYYQRLEVIGFVGLGKIPFKAQADIRGDKSNCIMISVENENCKNDDFYQKINTDEKEFKSVLLRAIKQIPN